MKAWILTLAAAVLAVPATSRAYEALIVATGKVIEQCQGAEPREVPFKATLSVRRAAWPDSAIYTGGGETSFETYWTDVMQTVQIGDWIISGPASLEISNTYSSIDDGFRVTHGLAGERFDWSLRGGFNPYIGPVKLRHLEERSQTQFWLFAYASGRSTTRKCEWTTPSFLYPAVESISISTDASPRSPAPSRHGICAVKSIFIIDQAAVRSGYFWVTYGLARVVTGQRLAMAGDAYLGGQAVVGTDLILDDAAAIGGTASVVGSAYLHPDTHVGNLVEVDAADTSCTCGFDLDGAFAEARERNDNFLLSGVPGYDGVDLVLDGGTAVLPPGRFHVRHLVLTGGARVVAPEFGVAELFVAGHTQVLGGSSLGRVPATSLPYSFEMASGLVHAANGLALVSGARLEDGTHVRIEGGSTFVGHLIAPKAPVYLYDAARLGGSLSALEIEMTGDTDITVIAPTEVLACLPAD